MRFADVNGQKIRASFVIVIKIYEVAYLAAERWSGVTAKNQDERALADAIAEMELSLAIEAHQRDVRSAIADVEVAAMPLRQRVAQEAVHISRTAHEMAKHAVNKDEDYEHY
jgi:2-polyprenyl-6-methoxyphenol hydroxylase-like FAD-dependent oxidoreductase